MRISVPYGEGALEAVLPDGLDVTVIGPGCGLGEEVAPPVAPSAADEQAEIRRALAEPIGAPRLSELAAAARTAAVVVSDVTRPCPSHRILPALLEELSPLRPEQISILFALGGHRPHSPEEQVRLVGEEVARSGVRLLDLETSRCRPVGTTSRGTRLEVFEPYLEADLRVCVGNIEYHYFAGFSGGAKAVVPGLCSYAAISDNHSMMLAPTARAGIMEGNPVREDIDEAAEMIGIDFILNVLLDEEKRIWHAVAGHFLAAHRAGAEIYDRRCDLRIAEAADVVIASPGGRPKDINLYQAQKTLDNVSGAVKDGGVIVLVARCPEGFGQRVFEEWMTGMGRPQVLIDRIRREFVLGGHKAAAVAGLLDRADVYLVSEFPDDVVRRMCMTPFSSVDEAVAAALARAGDAARCLVVPHGSRVTAAA
ncbi:MAG TPA: nickel-dependent lactate racemase [Thermoleophilia bacterium]|nr:nickel-dependent lactate racemase [Thermoleophilia bacterium]HQJ25994.1 nickel-dependent lactate racemase [Thermoleophilia bacterium]